MRSISERMFCISIVTATELKPPSGMMTSAYFFEGSTNSSCIGFTVEVYCVMTDCIVRPRSQTSRRMRRARRISEKLIRLVRISLRLYSRFRQT